MVGDPLTLISTRQTPQDRPADPRQVANSAGGYVFTLDPIATLRRFLIMGVAGGTFYASEKDTTEENAQLVLELARTRGLDVVAEILAVSVLGRAPKQEPALFALAAVSAVGEPDAKAAAHAILPQVARTGYALFTFLGYIEQFRGWGPTLRRAVSNWYLNKSVDWLCYQLVKYRSRKDWTHRDALRLAHPKIPQILADDGKTRIDVDADASARRAAFDFACGRRPAGAPWHMPTAQEPLRMLEGFLKAQGSPSPAVTAQLVQTYGLPWEALLPEHLNDKHVWGALVDGGMPQTALMRNLPKLTQLGLLNTPTYRSEVAQRLATGMSRAKVHPLNVLVALRTYASGTSLRGDASWIPAPAIVDALDAGFYEAFGGVEPAGKRTMFALDISGSMSANAGGLPLSCAEAGTAMGMVIAATEPDACAFGFTAPAAVGHPGRTVKYGGGWTGGSYALGGRWGGGDPTLTPLDLSNRRRLDDVMRDISALPMGGTDCSLPMRVALAWGLEVDTFIVATDNETWYGDIHPHQALTRYREQTGINARMVVLGMATTNFTIADPSDAGSLDVVGMDSFVPTMVADFSAGRI